MSRVETLKAKYGEDYFKRLGAKGGKNTPKAKRGFSDPEVARRASALSKVKK